MGTTGNIHKEEAQKQWNNIACGEVEGDQETLEYFQEVENYRYGKYAPWMPSFYPFSKSKEKKVLEIGYGQGTDHVQFAKNGAECYGVDITQNHFDLATRNLQLRGLTSNLFLEDASKLHFEDNFFDIVYSFGVLHHTPDTVRCISEAYRVLKPGGKLYLTFYHKHSAYHWFVMLMHNGIFKGKLRKLGYRGLLSTIERGADGIKIKPWVKLYTRQEFKHILADFSDLKIDVRHIEKFHFAFLGRLLPKFVVKWLGKKIGWYIIATATK